ncbi:MAG: HD domain-containing protein [Lachnospiraceae bacterium]|nr:HD domain-containing protein [Lachnospiraceae bacterium]
MERGIKAKIKRYGRDILSSDTFKRALEQVHHYDNSVGRHSLQVAWETLRVCKVLRQLGIEVDERKAVRAALLHDLGMIGREMKYANNYETSRKHPVDSLAVARKLVPDLDESMIQAIERHMFPIFAKPPTKAEAVAVCIADKLASIKEVKEKAVARLGDFMDSHNRSK